ncbi:HAD-IIB family hydrolase [Chachezhania sediminis]|uniref:HAD-IIB family hydrolase n=1 Tax=Chachezhania sediminis TaxID=2599291 RepID=UPI00131EC751|nr:HAD-IIB family hydrolase [Chachezhania sediminis]
MTRHERFADKDFSNKDFVLATDLDGTFLGGSDKDREMFYGWIEASRDRVGLIFVTGRDPGFISDLTKRRGVPRPDYVVGDVGTTIASVDHHHFLSPIQALEAHISEAWGDAGARVNAALRGVSGLRLQPTLFRHRVSYDMDPAEFDPRAVEIVEDLGLDALISDNRFFDVLPKGVSKGPSLRRLLEYLGVEEGRTLVAGDTMNDLSMIASGLPAVAVGNSEEALKKEVADLRSVTVAQAHGVAGIAEAIQRFEMFPKPKEAVDVV